MLKFQFVSKRSHYQLLCLGAHSDDIEIGCGGTILKLVKEHKSLEVHWIVFSADPERKREALKSAGLFLRGVKKRKVLVQNFRTSFFPYQGAEIKEVFEHLKGTASPDLILTHYRRDLHQDHRVINELTWNTFRDHLILEYEIPKYDGDFGIPNFFVPLADPVCSRKVKLILSCFQSQRDKHWFTEDTFRALMRLRGVESGSPGNQAEGFYSRKAVLS